MSRVIGRMVLRAAVAAAIGLTGCAARGPEGVVEWVGAQHAAVHDGDVGSKVRLKDLARRDHLYAIGPVEGLRGEIIVVDGRATIVTVEGGEFRTRESLDVGAAFLVWTHARAWVRSEMPPNVRTMEELEAHLPEAARAAGVDPSAPIAFRIEGRVKSLAFHVLNPPPSGEGGVRSAEDHEKSKIHGRIEDRAVRMVGFYSTEHRGVFTPGTSDVHVHFVTEDGTIAGHVEGFELSPGAVLLVAASVNNHVRSP